MELNRNEIIQKLVTEIESWPFSIACWQSGSIAHQRNDEYSDVDLVICVQSNHASSTWPLIQSSLNSFTKIKYMWRVPDPTWHGHQQTFYQLEKTPEYFFLDFVVMEEQTQHRFLEKERHGLPIVYFDKKDFIQINSSNTPEFHSKRNERLKIIAASFPFYKAILLKEILRKKPIDAWAFYRHHLNIFVELLGMQYRPLRYDFGFRYTQIDFPESVKKELENFCFPADLDDIAQKSSLLESRITELIHKLNDTQETY